MPTEHLSQLVNEGLVLRREIHAYPTEVYYKLSRKGEQLGPILSALDEFGKEL